MPSSIQKVIPIERSKISINIRDHLVRKYPHKKWNWSCLGNINFDTILSNLDKDFSFGIISNRSDISWEAVKAIHSHIKLNPNSRTKLHWKTLTERLPWKVIKENPSHPWHGLNINLKINPEKHLDSDTITSLSNNPSINYSIVKSHPYNWNWYSLSRNLGIKLEDIFENPSEPFYGDAVSARSDLTIEFIRDNPSPLWNWKVLIINPAFTWASVLSNLDLGWGDKGILSRITLNPNGILWSYVKAHPEEYFDPNTLSMNSDEIDWDIVITSYDGIWNWVHLSRSKAITIGVIRKILELFRLNCYSFFYETELEDLIAYENAGLELRYQFLKRIDARSESEEKEFHSLIPGHKKLSKLNKIRNKGHWDWPSLSRNPSITFDMILANPDLPWDPVSISYNPNVSIEIIKGSPQFNWRFDHLSASNSIECSDIESNPDLPWNYDFISEKHNLTIEFIERNESKLNWEILIYNEFNQN